MKRLLLSLCLVGAVFPGHTRLALQTGPPTSVEQPIEARAVFALAGTAVLGSMPQPPDSGVEHTAVQSFAMVGRDAQAITSGSGDKQQAPLPTPGAGLEPSKSPEPANWVVVIRGATVHSGPSISAPIVRLYSVGTELHLTDYQHGWFQVLDPVTSQRGWIYEKYYLQAIRGPGQTVAALEGPVNPPQEVVKARKPTLHMKRAKKIVPLQAGKIQGAPRYRYETVASILDKALRP